MSTADRLPPPWGQLIDRDRALEFEFDGRRYSGYAGDTLSSALAANSRWIMSRSFKYHRPRGSASFAGWDANSYVQVGGEPNVPGDLLPLEAGLAATPQNVLGSLDRDFASATRFLKRFLPVGFYYRAFFRPRGAWKWWEPLFRSAAGLGRIDTAAPRRGYFDKQHLFTDVAVVGAGPAGLSAAIAAAEGGADVLLAEESPVLGGSLNYARFGRTPGRVAGLRDELLARVTGNANVRVLAGTTCSGWFADNWLSLHTRARLYKVRAGRVVLAAGSVEQPAVFGNNDIPGVMTGSAAQRLMRLYGVRPGNRAAVVTSNEDGEDVAKDLIDAGVDVVAVFDLRAGGLRRLKALPESGGRHVKGIAVTHADGRPETVGCDLIVTSVGYAPLGQLACHDGGRLEYDNGIHAFRIGNCPSGGDTAGSVNHIYELDAVLSDGAAAGDYAVGALNGRNPVRMKVEDPMAGSANHPYPIYPHPDGNEYVDFDEDQTIADLINAVGDGFGHPELAKRYSTAAMGPSQGRMSATNAMRIVSRANGGNNAGQRITTQRPPFRPAPMGVLAGRGIEPERLTAMHDWHAVHDAAFAPAGLWRRPAYYGPGREQCVRREVAAIRRRVGLIDVSTLGGLEIRGPDAAEFLERFYTFAYRKQPLGRTRYVLMTGDTGAIIDDGVAARLGDEHFYVTTTTAGSDTVYRTMLRRNAQWRLRVDIANVTSGLAAMNIAGPLARAVISRLDADIDFSKEAFPYLGVRRGRIMDIPVLAMRVGFVGELSYELHAPASRALELWEALLRAGREQDVHAVGVEAQRVLRLEKGHIIVGQDTDGLTHPGEADMSWAVARRKPYFVGRAAIACFGGQPLLRRLVGFELPVDIGGLPDECNLVLRGETIAGRVTSIAHSAELEKNIGLAYVHPDDAAPGSTIVIKRSDGARLKGAVVTLPFLDPSGARQEL